MSNDLAPSTLSTQSDEFYAPVHTADTDKNFSKNICDKEYNIYMSNTPFKSCNSILQITSVKGDPLKIEAVKSLGHGMLSHAFQVGLDVILGSSSKDHIQLIKELEHIDESINSLYAKREIIQAQLKNIEAFQAQKDKAQILDNQKYVTVLNEFKRLSPRVIFDRQVQMCEHLASQLKGVTTGEVKRFFEGRKTEPTEEEIEQFIGGRV